MTEEYILTEKSNRFVLYPIKHDSIWQMYKTAISAFWQVEEIDLSKDIDDWDNKLNNNEKFFIENVLAFFAASDGIVDENLITRFYNDVKLPEARAFYTFQMAMESIHCCSGDTLILTNNGYHKLDSLIDKKVQVWNGQEFSDVAVRYTGDSMLYIVNLSNGTYLKCTPEHKWYISNNGVKDIVLTKDLKLGDIIYKYELPVVDSDNNNFDVNNVWHVPINYSIKTKIEWLNNILKKSLGKLGGITVEKLRNIQFLLSTLGCMSYVTNDGNIFINENHISKLVELGVLAESLEKCTCPAKEITVVAINRINGIHPTYCFNEPKNHSGVFNCILTGQSEMYSLMIDTFIKDMDKRSKLFDAMHTIPTIKKKSEWALKWITDKESSFATRLIAFAAVEGIMFSGAFASIYWLKERNLMPGLCASNVLISRDEGLHAEFAVLLYSFLANKLEETVVHQLIQDATNIEIEFITESIPCSMLGMNNILMSDYIKFVADRLLSQLGYSKLYNAANPFHFMERISLENKTNFFEDRALEYRKAFSSMTNNAEVFNFSTDADF